MSNFLITTSDKGKLDGVGKINQNYTTLYFMKIFNSDVYLVKMRCQ
jgi:hypothetical protein